MEDFFLKILNLSLLFWEEILIPILRNKFISLAHLLHIYSLLRWSLGIDPLEELSAKYRQPLISSEIQALQRLFGLVNIPKLIELLHRVMVETLVRNVSLGGRIPLSDVLVEVEEFAEFVNYFPRDIRLEGIWEVYQYLKNTAGVGGAKR